MLDDQSNLWNMLADPSPDAASSDSSDPITAHIDRTWQGVEESAIDDIRHMNMRERYPAVEQMCKARFKVRVVKWRASQSGCAWQVMYRDGTTANLIASPRPRGPISAGIFLHEIGHHAIGFKVFRPRCLEEYVAWQWSLDAMRRFNLNITPKLHHRVDLSLRYAIAKAQRRGLKRMPAVLLPFMRPAV